MEVLTTLVIKEAVLLYKVTLQEQEFVVALCSEKIHLEKLYPP